MKKYIQRVFILGICFLFIGCMNNKDVVENFSSKVSDVEGYHINGQLEIHNSEDKYVYEVDVAYLQPNNFKVSLTNTTNNHEQIILRNGDGVFVLTPSLNKSFKFQSEWPFNSSQIYLLQTILTDLESDENLNIEETDDGYIVYSTVSFTNNSNLTKQKVYFDKEMNLKSIEVLNNEDGIEMKMIFDSIDYNSNYDENYFKVDSSMTSGEDQTTSAEIDNIIYPMYLPLNTTLTNQQTIALENGERVILTFDGENPFTVIQETTSITEKDVIIPTMGELNFVTGTIGYTENNSVTWTSNGIDFYITSDILNEEELLKIANSTNYITVGK